MLPFGYYGLAVTERHYYVFKEHCLVFISCVPVSLIKKAVKDDTGCHLCYKQVVYEMAKSSEKREKEQVHFDLHWGLG